ncbi:hypothetical protein Ahy_B10g102134 [Arachis hypogaea]|uniref:Protein FAR1-RELATED SEQUENCE n=1 Tax=Arachis hypogaea TaxID=3818 RepID=A0A444X1B1_ARAHY|nr:hypothetical protein Ahy_B10g102134 [Arachis hypogaea]
MSLRINGIAKYQNTSFLKMNGTTSQCEGIRSLIKHYISKKCYLLDLMHNLNEVVRKCRTNEILSDFKHQKRSSQYFYQNMFKEVRNEIVEASKLSVISHSNNGNKIEVRTNKYQELDKDTKFEKIAGIRYGSLTMLCFTLCDKESKHRDDFMEIREDIFGLIMKLHKRHSPNEKLSSTTNLVGDPICRCPKLYGGECSLSLNEEKLHTDNDQSSTESNDVMDTKKDRISNVQKSNKRKRSRQPKKEDHKEVSTEIVTYGVISYTKGFENFQYMNRLSMYPNFNGYLKPPCYSYRRVRTPIFQINPSHPNVANYYDYWNARI